MKLEPELEITKSTMKAISSSFTPLHYAFTRDSKIRRSVS